MASALRWGQCCPCIALESFGCPRADTTQEAAMSTKARSNDLKFEIVVITVSDVDRAKEV